MKNTFSTVDAYIASFPPEVQEKLVEMRRVILENCPPSVLERISYGMPAYQLNKKPLVYFGGFARHVGFFATPTGHDAFTIALAPYKQGKGSVQFPFKTPLPLSLVAEIVRFRVGEVMG